MQFIYPGFLFALFALAIPIIIHLFNFRRFKKIYFTNVRFLREIRQDTQSRSRVRHLLILLSRLLAVAFLVFAFAQPFIPQANVTIEAGTKKVSIYIDNSFSMDALGKNGSLLESGKKKAREIAMAFNPSDRFQLLTTDFESRHQRLVTREEFLQLVDEVKPGSSVHLLSEVLQRQDEALSASKEKGSKNAFIISDFQKSITDGGPFTDTTLHVSLVPVAASVQNNLYIDTCYLSTPFVQLNVPAELTVVIKNAGNTDAENTPVRLTINGNQKSIASVSAKSGSFEETKLTFTINEPGWQQAALSISDYPVTFDDNFYFSFKVRSNIDIISINGKDASPSINSVFANDDYFRLRNFQSGQIDYSLFPSTQLIILNEVTSFTSGFIQELQKYVKKGGTLFIIPSEEADLTSYRELTDVLGMDSYSQFVIMEDRVTSIETKNTLFSNVFEKEKGIADNLDLPVVTQYFTFSRRPGSTSQPVMKLRSGNPFLLASTSASGNVYILASSLRIEAGSFSRHALFVPIFLRAALQGSSEINEPLVIGRDHDFIISDTLVSNDNIFHLVNSGLNFDIIPESRLLNPNTVIDVHDQVTDAQNYELRAEGSLISVISFNYDRKESNLSVLSDDDLKKLVSQPGYSHMAVVDAEDKDLSHSISQFNQGKRLWKYCIIAALIFLATEIFLIRYFNRTKLSTS